MPRFYEFKNESAADAAELVIYDEVGFFGTRSKDFHDTLKRITAKKLTIRINSPGGNIVEGYAIFNLLRTHPSFKEVRIDGIAASIASVIAMVGDSIIAPENTFLFVHLPTVFGGGDSEDLRRMADELDKMRDAIVRTYVNRSKGKASEAKIRQLMDDETLLTAQEAADLGLVDIVEPELKAVAKANFVATDFLPAKAAATFTAVASASRGSKTQHQQGDTMTAEEQARMDALVAENNSLKQAQNGHKTALEQASNSARQEATNNVVKAENDRKTGILAIRDKYDKNGDLADVTVKALAGKTTIDEFKDQVLDAVANRATTGAVKPGQQQNKGDETESDFQREYKAAKNGNERRAVLRKFKKDARDLARNLRAEAAS